MKELLSLGIPLACIWFAVACALSRAYSQRRELVVFVAVTAFMCGYGLTLAMTAVSNGEAPYGGGRLVGALVFLCLCAVSVLAPQRSFAINAGASTPKLFVSETVQSILVSLLTGVVLGGMTALMLPGRQMFTLFLPVLMCILMTPAALAAELHLSRRFTFTPHSLLLFLTSLTLMTGALSPRLNLFTPLSMKLMKFIHDFVHQFFESMLIPDHLFFTSRAWNYIGFLFGNQVGFWGGLAIWFAPSLLIIMGILRGTLPSVAHIRQGAQRRKLMASYLRERRDRTVIPLISVLILILAVYRSLNPAVEYWDPKPVEVFAKNGLITIPINSDGTDLGDGKLHKFITRQGEKEVRFFLLKKPDGTLTMDLDACAICQPEGYGQGNGTVICYYCKTLIPIETVGQPGGCNPVPVRFSESDGAVLVQAGELFSTWNANVQGSKTLPGRGK